MKSRRSQWRGSTCAPVGDTRSAYSVDERTRPTTLEQVWRAFGITRDDRRRSGLSHAERSDQGTGLPDPSVFHMNRAETEMMRYMRRLADRDLALDGR